MRTRLFATTTIVLGLLAACSAGKDESPSSARDAGAQGETSLDDGGTTDDAALDDTGGASDDATTTDTATADATLTDTSTASDAPATDTAVAPDAGPTYALVIKPTDATVALPGGSPGTVGYYAQWVGTDGTAVDVTGSTTWTIDDATLGTFAGSILTVKKAGKTNVHAAAKGTTAVTSLTVSAPVTVIATGAPSDAPTKFGGTVDASRKPSFVYPSDGTLVPPNMNVIELHYLPGAGNSLFELAFTGPAVDLKVYLKCDPVSTGCVYTPDPTVWKWLSDGSRGAGPVTYTLRGVDGTTPGSVGVSASQKLSFAQEDIVGGVYYWNAKAGATMRYEFGVTGKTAETYMNAAKAGASTCVGCHVVSRDGTRIAIGMDIPSPSPYRVFDVATKTVVYSQGTTFGGGSNFFSFSPDTKQIATSNGISIVLRSAKDGSAIVDPLVAKGAMPDWSPDGTKIVFAAPASTPPCVGFCGATGVDAASIQVLTYAGGAWSKTSTTLVPYTTQNNFYPAYSPDGAFVIFDRSPSNANSYDAKDAQVWVVPEAGGTAIRLATASTGGDSWPKWAPDVQAHKGGKLLWLTFSSRRAYGLRLADGAQAQIWMVGFDPAKAKAGLDPTGPAFWLPFQDLASGNHIAQWVKHVARKPCGDATYCEATEACVSGVCRPVIK